MTVAMACVYVLLMLVLGIAFLVEWIRNYRWIKKYLKSGLVVGFLLVGLNLSAVFLARQALGHLLAVVLVAYVFSFVQAVGFSMLGMYYCAQLGLPSIRLARRPLEPADRPPIDEGASCEGALPFGNDTAEAILVEPPVEAMVDGDSLPGEDCPPAPAAPAWNMRMCALHVALVVIVSVVYSILLFKATWPQVSEMAKRTLGISGEALAAQGTLTPQALLVLLAFAFGEEVFFRLGIQNFLAYRLGWRADKYWLAILATTCLWTLGHAGTLEPGWVKFAQIFPLGLLLGWLFKRHGLESAICAHGLFNCLLAIPALDLIS